MKKMAVSKFRAQMMKILKQVESGVIVTLTSRGKEVAYLCPPPMKEKQVKNKLKQLQETARIGDILSPISDDWESAK